MFDAAMRFSRWSLGLALFVLVLVPWARGDDPPKKIDPNDLPAPVQLTAQEDQIAPQRRRRQGAQLR
jgi:hypothetical protein